MKLDFYDGDRRRLKQLEAARDTELFLGDQSKIRKLPTPEIPKLLKPLLGDKGDDDSKKK